MKNNFKKYVETSFDRIKQSATQFVSDKPEAEEEPSIELDPHDYERLRQKAARQNTTVQQLLNQAIRNLLEDRVETGTAPAITERQREANPLLLLDALTDKHETDLAFRSHAPHAPAAERTGVEESL
ncbi:hypothetical protein J31TS4_22240 [Paenibacillus sp. J31TS4]|uniref:hypothetical protein n=1 Tax=Paenibacillus sp. J31TS4 TaxID=2807195 RepID=UPI001B2D0991|nr:hypothetical protein [Paenibacillus sp. J31TS4]GIP38944.1 hypothetical protein J31TS4_22240 [Paenibacillus sp. J31TS4]